ncbi:MAG: acyl-CoA synthetase, partial [Armatimonadota bacterium]|nr:acyl-CoA synthetase [Armatimonadota bacterium]
MDPLALKISDFVQSHAAEDSDADFNALALALFARQYERCAPYRRLCDSQGLMPQTVRRWQDIPAVPAQAFKVFDLSCVSLPQTVAIFHSSGTTGIQTSKHY